MVQYQSKLLGIPIRSFPDCAKKERYQRLASFPKLWVAEVVAMDMPDFWSLNHCHVAFYGWTIATPPANATRNDFQIRKSFRKCTRRKFIRCFSGTFSIHLDPNSARLQPPGPPTVHIFSLFVFSKPGKRGNRGTSLQFSVRIVGIVGIVGIVESSWVVPGGWHVLHQKRYATLCRNVVLVYITCGKLIHMYIWFDNILLDYVTSKLFKLMSHHG